MSEAVCQEPETIMDLRLESQSHADLNVAQLTSVVSDEKRPGQHFWCNRSKKYATWTQPAGWTARWKEAN